MRRSALLVALAALAVACGVPEDDGPQELSADEVPFGLLTTAPTTTTTPVDLPPSREAELYFVNEDEMLEPLAREVEDRDPATVVATLLATDTAGLPSGLSSSIPPDTELLGAETEDELLTVDLSEQFNTVEGQRFIRAVAQIVFTATQLQGIDLVSFRVEGEPQDVADDDGATQGDPVGELDYIELLDPGA